MPLKFLAGKTRKDETFLACHAVNAESYGLKKVKAGKGVFLVSGNVTELEKI